MVQYGTYINSEEPPDYFQFIEKGQVILDRGAKVTKRIDHVLSVLEEKKTPEKIADIISKTDNIMKEVETYQILLKIQKYKAGILS